MAEKNLAGTKKDKRLLIEHDHQQISIKRQCELLGISRASLYYQPVGFDARTLELMRLLDEQYTQRLPKNVKSMPSLCVVLIDGVAR